MDSRHSPQYVSGEDRLARRILRGIGLALMAVLPWVWAAFLIVMAATEGLALAVLVAAGTALLLPVVFGFAERSG